MDFFQAQDKARQSTTRLVMLFICAVIALIVITNLLVVVFMSAFSGYFGNDLVTGRYIDRALEANGDSIDILSSSFWEAFFRTFDWEVFLVVGLIVTSIITAASLYKIMILSSGGKAVVEMLGGRLVSQNTQNPMERKVLNVVEEMAIASGTPVPPVYILSESGINAFAAGFSPGDAVIGITEGCLQYLNRDQLQGVIAHELSHIINGDIRLNIRLMGLLHGILVIGIIGYHLLRSIRYSRSRRSDSAGAVIALGFGLTVIGFVGSFFGSLIKASVSRQREYLADASAVQFTRNPEGIAGALKKIGGSTRGSVLENPSAPEVSHAFFANGVHSFLTSLFATHPPLKDRIRRLQPHWNGKFLEIFPQTDLMDSSQASEKIARKDSFIPLSPASAAITFAMEHIGRPQQQHLQYAHELIEKVPSELIEAMREPYGARALIYTFIINKEPPIRQLQLKHLKEQGDKGVYELTTDLLTLVDALDNQFRLPLIDASIASMRQLSPQQYQLFKKNFTELIKVDNKISIFEWTLQRIIFHYLDAEFIKHSIFSATAKYSKLSQLKNEIEIILSLLVHAEYKIQNDAERAFKEGKQKLTNLDINLLKKSKLTLSDLNNAIDQLALLKPLLKPQVLKACAACITSNKKASPTETELLRAFSAAIDCPMPLLRVC